MGKAKLKIVSHMEIRTKVAGVTQPGRQEIIRKRLKAGSPLLLVPEPENPVDPKAVAVYVPASMFKGSAQIGYLPRTRAEQIQELWAMGKKLTVTVSEVTGGVEGKETRGVNILVVY